MPKPSNTTITTDATTDTLGSASLLDQIMAVSYTHLTLPTILLV